MVCNPHERKNVATEKRVFRYPHAVSEMNLAPQQTVDKIAMDKRARNTRG